MDSTRFLGILAGIIAAPALADITPIELTPGDVSSASSATFSDFPTMNPSLYLPLGAGSAYHVVDFNTAPGGPLSEGQSFTDEYATLGVLMNDVRISADIYGGNWYGTGFAAEDDAPQIYTFTVPVVAVGIVNTSPDRDLIQVWSGPNATGTLLLEFTDQMDVGVNFNIDRFVGAVATDGETIGSILYQNQSGNLELDELIFVVAVPDCLADTNGDGTLTPADFTAWINAFNNQLPACDQNADGACTPADFTAWINNYNAGC